MPAAERVRAMVELDGALLPRRLLYRSLFLAALGTCLGSFFFGLATGNVFNRFLEFAGFKEEIPLFVAVAGFTGVVQVFGSWVLQRSGRRRLFFFLFTIPPRIMWCLIVFLPELLPGEENAAARMWLLLAAAVIYWSSNRLATNAYTSWMRDLVPEGIRGRYFGAKGTVVTLVGAVWGLGAAYLLERLGLSGHAFKLIYLVGMVFGLLDVGVYFFVHHPPMQVKRREEASLRRMLRAALHRDFLRFILVQSVWSFTATVVGVCMYYLMRALDMEIYAMNTVAFAATMVWLVFSTLWGMFVDRFGAKAAYITSLITHSLSPVFYALAPVYGAVFIYVGIVVGSIGACGIMQSATNLIYGLSRREDQAMSYAAFATIAGIVGGTAGVLLKTVIFPFFQARTPAWGDPRTFYLMASFSAVIFLRWLCVLFASYLPEQEGKAGAWVVVRMFYTTNPLRAVYSLGRFLRAKSSDVLSGGSYGEEHPSARWRLG